MVITIFAVIFLVFGFMGLFVSVNLFMPHSSKRSIWEELIRSKEQLVFGLVSVVPLILGLWILRLQSKK